MSQGRGARTSGSLSEFGLELQGKVHEQTGFGFFFLFLFQGLTK